MRNAQSIAGRWSLYSELRLTFLKMGCDANRAADLALAADRAWHRRKNEAIRRTAKVMTLRETARLWGISKTHVHRIVEDLSPDAQKEGQGK